MAHLKLNFILFGLNILFRYCAWKYPEFKSLLTEKAFTAVIRTKDGSVARWYRFGASGYSSGAGRKDNAEVVMTFKTAAIGAKLLMPPIDQLEQINALKDFVITLEGPEEEATWFTQTIVRTQSIGWKYGVDQGNGVTRYTQMTNGGPIFAYVKDDKIIRITPIEFDRPAEAMDHQGAG